MLSINGLAQRVLIASALTLSLVLSLAGPMHALTPVRHALLERHATVERAREIRHVQAELEADLRRQIAAMAQVARGPAGRDTGTNDRRPATVEATTRLLEFARARLHSLDPWARTRLRALRARYANLQAWLDREGIFRFCPVPDYGTIYDNFGDTVRIPHVPVHTHQGNDIQATFGARIVAPFDGYASSSSSKLGGVEIRVFGAEGYVYNAHIGQIGQLGWVSAGDTVGYVGVTGDATGPHDHLEWHPNDGLAQDPNALLVAACVDQSG